MKEINFGNIMLLFIFFGIILIAYQIGFYSRDCPIPIAKFKYLPRDFNLDSNYPDNVSYQFKDMFEKPTPYLVDLGNNNKRELVGY